MKAIIMAGGEGKRLKPVTGDVPKPMALMSGAPILEHVLLLLRACGVDNICMSLRYRAGDISAYFGNGERFGMRISYHVENEPLGTAGGVKACLDEGDKRDLFVISGDCICDFDLRQLAEAHFRHKSAVTIALYPSSTPLRYGVVLTSPEGRVASFTEKPDWPRVVSDLINTGIYVVSPRAMELVPENTKFDFSGELFPLLMQKGMEIRALEMAGYWSDIGTPRSYHQTCLDALDGKIRLPGCAEGVSTGKDAEAPAQAEARGQFRVPCSDRARVMRFVSQTLMEAGADFSDGLCVRSPEGLVHIAPAGRSESIIIGAQAGGTQTSTLLASKYARLVSEIAKSNQ